MVFLNIYIAGFFLALLILAVMLEYAEFLEYLCNLIKSLLDLTNKEYKLDPYTLIIPFSIIIAVFSIFGIIFDIALIIDYIKYRKDNEKEK